MRSMGAERILKTAGSEADADLLARCVWSRITEPADPVVGTLLATIGPVRALEWLGYLTQSSTGTKLDSLPRDLRQLAPKMVQRLRSAVLRWQPRIAEVEIDREMRAISNFAGRVIGPEQPGWPAQLADLGFEAPICLWVRGDGDPAQITRRSIALVGARASTMYGQEVTAGLTSGLCEREFSIISGGAYGIDITAQRVALASGGTTVAVMAGGVDRFYPRGNAHILEASLETGIAVSEHPPGSAPTRSRFLTRNRLIAALAQAVIVVEAAQRSGALSTARHGVKLGRPLGVVPGPVTSMMSSGCHDLLRNEHATCVTDAAEAAEIAGNMGADLSEQVAVAQTLFDTLDNTESAVIEALPLKTGVGVDNIARTAGISVDETIAALARLELQELAKRNGSVWRRA